MLLQFTRGSDRHWAHSLGGEKNGLFNDDDDEWRLIETEGNH